MDLLRQHRLDAALVGLAGIVVASSLTGSGGATFVGGAVGAASLVVLIARRWQPLAAAVLAFAGLTVAAQVSPRASGAEFFAVLAVFAVAGTLATRRDAVVAWVFGCLSFGAAMSHNPHVGGAGDIALTLAFCTLVWGAGLVAAERGRTAALARERAEVAEDSRDRQVRAATEEERARIAVEIHDIVSHGLSVVVVQTVAARMALDDAEPAGQVDRRLDAVETTAREALADMRRLLGLLDHDDPGRTPAASAVGLAQVPALVETVRGTGLRVDLAIEEGLDLPPGLDATCSRIVQEALTNVIKHGAGPVRVVVGTDRAELLVHIESQTSDSGQLPGSGRGLIGMRQRAEVYGGSLTTGARDGRFTVIARLPLPDESAPTRGLVRRGRRRSS